VADILLGSFALIFGAVHVIWPRQMYQYYQRSWLRYFSGSSQGAMKVHGMLLAALGVVLIVLGLVTA